MTNPSVRWNCRTFIYCLIVTTKWFHHVLGCNMQYSLPKTRHLFCGKVSKLYDSYKLSAHVNNIRNVCIMYH